MVDQSLVEELGMATESHWFPGMTDWSVQQIVEEEVRDLLFLGANDFWFVACQLVYNKGLGSNPDWTRTTLIYQSIVGTVFELR